MPDIAIGDDTDERARAIQHRQVRTFRRHICSTASWHVSVSPIVTTSRLMSSLTRMR